VVWVVSNVTFAVNGRVSEEDGLIAAVTPDGSPDDGRPWMVKVTVGVALVRAAPVSAKLTACPCITVRVSGAIPSWQMG
jgi:hypothetical protein